MCKNNSGYFLCKLKKYITVRDSFALLQLYQLGNSCLKSGGLKMFCRVPRLSIFFHDQQACILFFTSLSLTVSHAWMPENIFIPPFFRRTSIAYMVFSPTSCIRITTLCSWLGEVAMTLLSNVTVACYILYLYCRAYTYILLENPEKMMNFYMPLSMFILLLNLNPFACVFWSNSVGNICFIRNSCITWKQKSPQKNRQLITQDLYFWWNMDSLRIAIRGMIELHSVFLLN